MMQFEIYEGDFFSLLEVRTQQISEGMIPLDLLAGWIWTTLHLCRFFSYGEASKWAILLDGLSLRVRRAHSTKTL